MKNLLKNKIVVNLLKFGLAAGILAYLVVSENRHQKFPELLAAEKDWGLIAAAAGLFFGGVLLSFFRWQLLVRALGFPFSGQDSLRLGFLGYLFNFVAPGGVGGDLFKAVFIAREFHGRRAQAVATVFIDRVVGLYALLVVASTVILWDGLWHTGTSAVRTASQGTLLLTAVGALFITMMLVPGITHGRVSRFLGNLPRTGRIFRQLIEAVRTYRERIGVVVAAGALSVVIHVLSVVGYYLLGRSLPGVSPTLSEHYVIVPLAMVVGAIPITPAGLGTFEWTVDYLFRTLSSRHVDAGRGLLISLIYRLITIAIAMIGVVVYCFCRKEVAAALRDAEEPTPDDAPAESRQ